MFDIFTRAGMIELLYTLPALLISIAIHEFSHAFVAYKLGDGSQKALGRLTLDPIKHIDPVGFLCIILCGFGWGKPVSIDESRFKNRPKGVMLVSLAGPLSNLLLALLFVIILKILIMTGLIMPVVSSSVGGILFNMFVLTIQFNVIFSVFNMIPLPPFDGSKVLYYFLPYKAKQAFEKIEQYSLYILIIFFVTGIGGYIISPIANFILGLLSYIL